MRRCREPALKPAPQTRPAGAREPAVAAAASGHRRRRAPAAAARVPPRRAARSSCAPIASKAPASKSIEASGKVELRTRRETVLADWLRYDFATDEIWGKGDVLIRYGIDWITGPELKYKRGTETGFFTSPRFFVGENNSRGSASEIRFAGPDHYEATDARYTTCVAPREDWYLRMGELEVDRTRMVGTGHDATVYFFGAPVIYSPWFEFPLSNERKSGFLTPTTGTSGTRGFEYSQPYYLNLAPNYDATITPRLMTKRGIQIGGQGRYLFESGAGRGGRGIPAERPRHRHGPVRAFVAAHAESRFLAARPHRLLEPQQGVRRHVLLGSVRPRRPHVADDAAARRRLRLHQRAVAGARARAGLPDAAGPDGAAAHPLQPRAAGARDAARDGTGTGSRSPASASTRTSGSRR